MHAYKLFLWISLISLKTYGFVLLEILTFYSAQFIFNAQLVKTQN